MTTEQQAQQPQQAQQAPAPQPPPPSGGPRRREGRRPRYQPRRKGCPFCVDRVRLIDYKDVGRLRRFLSDRAKIEPRRKTGVCASHQRRLAEAIKRARHLALLPFDPEQARAAGWTG